MFSSFVFIGGVGKHYIHVLTNLSVMILKTILEMLRQILHQQILTHTLLLERSQVMKEEDCWLHTEDVMTLFKKSEQTIYTWRKSGQIKYKMIGGTIYYLKSDLFRMTS